MRNAAEGKATAEQPSRQRVDPPNAKQRATLVLKWTGKFE
jgi:hypothetical protein